jgi:site-specific DNA recombinase
LKATETGFQEYYRYGISLLSNLKEYYCTANIENKQKMLGLIFSEKLVFSNKTFQTREPNEVLTLLCNIDKGFRGFKKEKSSNIAAQSCRVTASGFKPETF